MNKIDSKTLEKLVNNFEFYIKFVSKKFNIPKWQIRAEYFLLSF